MKNSDARPPAHLTRESRSLWKRLVLEYGIEDAGGLAVLQQACEALDRLRQAQAAITQDGPVIVDRFGQQKGHPMLATEQASRAAFLAAIKHLGLDVEPLRPGPGRPGGR
jgi:P27 family predicted phage terminase small subunit